MKKIVYFLMIATVLVSLAGCNKASKPTPGDPLTFEAKVLAVAEDADSIYVEAEGQKDFTRASISIFDDTEITFENGDKAELNDVKKDDVITITNYGLIAADDYPAQMSAKKVVINK